MFTGRSPFGPLEPLEDRIVPANLVLGRGTYLGTAGVDEAAAVVASPVTGAVFVAADFGGAARLQQFSLVPGSAPTTSVDLGGSDVRDAAAAGGDGRLVAVGDFGVRVFGPTATGAALWQKSGSFDRVAVADDGTVVALNTSTDTLTVWDSFGSQLATHTLAGGDVRSADVAIDPLTRRVFVTGYTQATSSLQVPFVRAFDRSGAALGQVWMAYGFSAAEVTNAAQTADSRGVRIEVGADGGLYLLGRTDGGNNVFVRDPKNVTVGLETRLVDPDQYTDTSNASGAKTFTFFAKLRIDDGQVERAQILVTRLSDGSANSFSPTAIAADRLGNVYVGGSSAATLQNRDAQTIDGQPVGSYRLGEPAILSVSADFQSRRFWTPLTAPGDADGAVGSIAGFAFAGTSLVVVGTVTSPGVATVSADLNPNPLGGADAFFASVPGVAPGGESGSAGSASGGPGGGGGGGGAVSRPQPIAAGAGNGGSEEVRILNAAGDTLGSIVGFPGGTRTAVGDANGDGVADYALGTAPGRPNAVRVVDGATGAILFETSPFEPAFAGGVFVALGDLTGDGRADLVVSPDEGGGPRVLVFDVAAGGALILDFLGIDDASFRGGARVAVGDLNADGRVDLIVAAGFGGGPRVAVFDGRAVGSGSPVRLVPDFFVFEPTLRNGVYVTAGDLDGDGADDLIVGGGPGGGPRVFALSGSDLLAGQQSPLANFFAGDPADRSGVRVAAKDAVGDGGVDLVVAPGPGTAPFLTVYAGGSIPADAAPPAFGTAVVFDPAFLGGVFVG